MHAVIRALGIGLAAGGLAMRAGADQYAAQNGQAPSGNYSSWATAASNIQDAVNAAATGAVVWVGAGRYVAPPNATNYVGTNVVFINRPLTLRSSNGLPDSVCIDGEGANRGIAVFYKTSTSNRFVLDGLTVSNCWATNMGGGILFNADNAARWTGVVQNCVIRDNTVAWGTNTGNTADTFRGTQGARGGGVAAYNWNLVDGVGLVLSNSVFRANVATSDVVNSGFYSQGGALYAAGFARFDAADCVIENNWAMAGGGAYIGWPATRMDRCVIRGNSSGISTYTGDGGGGLMLSQIGTGSGGGTNWLRDCLIYDNVSVSGGGIHLNNRPILSLYHCTIVSNRQTRDGGAGIYLSRTAEGAGLRVFNSIIYSNSHDLILASYTNSFFTNCCFTVTNNTPVLGANNITSPPAFASFAARDFRLSDASPCLNAGTNLPGLETERDLEGRPRIDRFWGVTDMGCYERMPSGALLRLR